MWKRKKKNLNHQDVKDIIGYLQYTLKKGLEQSGIFMVEQEKLHFGYSFGYRRKNPCFSKGK